VVLPPGHSHLKSPALMRSPTRKSAGRGYGHPTAAAQQRVWPFVEVSFVLFHIGGIFHYAGRPRTPGPDCGYSGHFTSGIARFFDLAQPPNDQRWTHVDGALSPP
jgi:hypothetical protein